MIPAITHSPRTALANALLAFHAAARDGVGEADKAQYREDGRKILTEAVSKPEFTEFLDTFTRTSELPTELTDPATSAATCDITHWDGTARCLLRISREHGDPAERIEAFRLFREELEKSCKLIGLLSNAQIDAMAHLIYLLDPEHDLDAHLQRIWDERKADSPCKQKELEAQRLNEQA